MSNNQTTKPQETGLAKKEMSHSERFTNAIIKEFSSNAGGVQLTSFQRKLCQNYFIKIDSLLKDNEKKRLAKDEKYRDPLAFTWENVNMPKLAIDVISFSSVGLDPVQPNHINLIPFKNNHLVKFDMTFIMGYRGIELKSKKYGYEVPDDVIVELVYTNDKFKSIKKDKNNRVESFEFDIVDDFERGEVKGGFYYHNYFDKPQKNKLRVFSMKDIMKRTPEKASAEFWGGEKDVWENKKKVGTKKIEGWFDEMCWKTIYRAAYNDITIDSEKIDEHFLKVIEAESSSQSAINIEDAVATEINEKANMKSLSFEEAETVEENRPEETKPEQNNTKAENNQNQSTFSGPGF